MTNGIQYNINNRSKKSQLGILLTLIVSLTSCGKQAFNVGTTTQAVSAPGAFSTPPKVDILMVVDDTGSMHQAYPAIRDQFPGFLTGLESAGFDFHATVIPMTTFAKISQAAGSSYDISSPTFKPSYPGDTGTGSGMLSSSVYRTSTSYNAYPSQSDMNTSANGKEPAFQNIAAMLNNGFTGTGFFRPNVISVLVIASNGNDTSDVNYCFRSPDNVLVPCEEAGKAACVPTASDPIKGGNTECGSKQTSLNYYKSLFTTALPNLKVYSVVPTRVVSNCLGGRAATRIGDRYQSLASALGGKTIDICSAGGTSASPSSMISVVLSDMTTYLKAQVEAYRLRYIMINENQVPSQVIRLIGGDPNNRVVLSSDPTQPLYWSYVGTVNQVNTQEITGPTGTVVQLSPASGNAIQFHTNGSGLLPSSTDTFEVVQAPPGATSSVSK